MKLPNDFTFTTWGGSKCRMKRIDGHYYCADINEVPTTDNARWTEPEMLRNFNEKAWTLLESFDKTTPEYPSQLSFYHDTTTQQYDLVKIPHINKWACYQDGSTHGATYTAEEIAEHFREGHWKEVSFAEDAPKDRELVFPITYKSVHEDCAYKIVKDDDGVLWWHCQNSDWVSTIPDLYSHEHVAERIKSGDWRVISAGPQKAPEATPSVSSPSGAPTSASKGFTLSVDSEQLVEATERANALAEALVAVRFCLEDFQAAVKNFNVDVEVV